jgi:hypothetical protein
MVTFAGDHVTFATNTGGIQVMMMMSYSEDWISRKFTNKL